MQFAWNNIWMLWFKDHYRFCYRHFISMCHDNNMISLLTHHVEICNMYCILVVVEINSKQMSLHITEFGTI